MEEDIKILEEIDITDFYNNYNEYTFPEEEIKRKCKAIENLLTRYKQMEAELEKKDRIIKEMAGHIILMNDSRGLTNEEKIKYFTDMVEREGK